jgi:hypothetical protein
VTAKGKSMEEYGGKLTYDIIYEPDSREARMSTSYFPSQQVDNAQTIYHHEKSNT